MKLHNSLKRLTLIFFFTIISSCQSNLYWYYFHIPVEPSGYPLPLRNIMFEFDLGSKHQLGFINSNGMNFQAVDIEYTFATPVWSRKGSILFGLTGLGPESNIPYAGYPAYWDLDTKDFKICNSNLPLYFQIEDAGISDHSYEVILYNYFEIVLYDIARCKEIKRYIDYNDNPSKFGVIGIWFNPSTQQLLFGRIMNAYDPTRSYQIVKMDLQNGSQEIIGEGINPSWSPDGNQIAYLGTDGLFIASSDGSEKINLTHQPLFEPWREGFPIYKSPLLRWSSDSKTLLYHRCGDELCHSNKASITTIEIDTGKEVDIFTGGIYPCWQPKQ